MDGQFKNCEKSCDFLSEEYDDQKTELQAAKSNTSGLQKRCSEVEDKCRDYETKTSKRIKNSLTLSREVCVKI